MPRYGLVHPGWLIASITRIQLQSAYFGKYVKAVVRCQLHPKFVLASIFSFKSATRSTEVTKFTLVIDDSVRWPRSICIARADRRLRQFLSKMLFVDMPGLAGHPGGLMTQPVACLSAR